jgi:hypothetical protein
MEAREALFHLECETLESRGWLLAHLPTCGIIRRIEAREALVCLDGKALESHG